MATTIVKPKCVKAAFPIQEQDWGAITYERSWLESTKKKQHIYFGLVFNIAEPIWIKLWRLEHISSHFKKHIPWGSLGNYKLIPLTIKLNPWENQCGVYTISGFHSLDAIEDQSLNLILCLSLVCFF